jgi:nitrogen-specific signal transduction histidine kinase
VRERLFQPFVSYGKENGTGLGLAVTQKIIQDHGGEIVVESTSTGRTIFKIVLPVQGFVDAVRANLTPQPLQPR